MTDVHARRFDLVIFDWAGTMVDFGCCAPIDAYVEAFARRGVTLAEAAARADMGIANLSTWVPWTTMIHYTPFDDAGSMLLRIAIDHRVLDGATVARALADLEHVLHHEILEELRCLRSLNAAYCADWVP